MPGDTLGNLSVEGGVRLRTDGEWRLAHQLWDTEQEEQLNTYFDRETAEQNRENMIESWPEHTEDSMKIVPVLVDVS